MNQSRWKQIDELFDAVLDLPEFQREAFLSAKCGADTELKNEVLTLLDAQNQTDNFLERSAIGVAAQRLAVEQSLAPDSRLIGKKVGTYRIESLLGSGGMGQVYLAHDEKLSRKVALKILPSEYVSSDERVKRFQIEARAVSALNHPNIVTIYDVGTENGINYIATEYVEGKTFRDLIGTGLKIKDILNVVIQTCEALSAAHTAGIIHRDIKPENIILRPDGYVKILDFGLAKLSEIDFNSIRNFTKTAQGVLIGTPSYMSPEQVADEKVDHRTDLWSIGVVLFELLTNVNPFKKATRQATFQAILSEEPPLPSSINPEISPELDQILIKALEKDADLSYQTSSDLRADLKRVKREFDSTPSLKSGASIFWSKSVKSSGVYFLVPLVFLVLVLLGFGVWWFYLRNSNNQPVEAIEWVSATNLQITQSSGVEGYPSLAPDGKNIIFASETNGDRNIYLQRVGGKNLTNLTPNSKENDTMPTFSANGKFIAFRSERDSGGMYVMEETGENVRKISDIGFHPSWSPDGKKIVVSDKAAAIHTVHTIPNSSLYLIDVATRDQTKIETGGDAIMPNWSPHGNRIAFWFVADGKLGEIATVPAEGGEPVVVARDPASDWNPVWSPDGKFLYFASDRGGNMNLWRIAIDEKTGQAMGEPESVRTPSKYCRHITFSRDGKILGYVRYESQSNLQAISFDPKTLVTTGEPLWITRGDREISNPSLSPNGEEYVVRIPSRTQEDMGIIGKNGSNIRTLTNDKFRERLPRWSPDGKKIGFQTDRSGKYQIWTINVDGSNAQQITFSENVAAAAPVFSPDGLHLAYTEIGPKFQSSFILDLTKTWADQTPKPVPSFDNKSFSVRDWSPNGKKLLYIFFEPDGDEVGIGVYDLEKKEHQQMTEIGSSPFWLNDNRHFIFSSQDTILLCDTQTKKITELYKPFAYEIQQAGISPDNKTIYFRYLQVDSDVWLMDASQKQ
jgi:eukaryotic-like serine/threonine-protein kinase